MFAVGSVVKGDILFRLQGDGTCSLCRVLPVTVTSPSRPTTVTPSRALKVLPVLISRSVCSMRWLLVCPRVCFAVLVLRAGTRVFNGHVLRADANTPLFAVNLHTFGQQAVARHQGDALVAAERA